MEPHDDEELAESVDEEELFPDASMRRLYTHLLGSWQVASNVALDDLIK